jgi:dTDP-4-amino-4,6-dideoxygalactose transaminase
MCGAQIDFVDIDPRSFNISVIDLEKRLRLANEKSVLPKVLIVVHMAGQSAEMREIAQICSRYSVSIVEDASHAIGADYEGEMVGCCKFSDVTVFSFHPVKIITTGEGGAVTTNSPELAARMRLLRSHGVTRDVNEFLNRSSGPWYYEQQLLGFNYRMSDFAAALGISQLSRIHEFVTRRNQLATRYGAALAESTATTPVVQPGRTSAFHLYILSIEFLDFSEKSSFFDAVKREGVSLNVHYRPIYQQPYYHYLGYGQRDYPEAENHYRRSVSIPLYAGLTDSECDLVVDALIRHLPSKSFG